MAKEQKLSKLISETYNAVINIADMTDDELTRAVRLADLVAENAAAWCPNGELDLVEWEMLENDLHYDWKDLRRCDEELAEYTSDDVINAMSVKAYIDLKLIFDEIGDAVDVARAEVTERKWRKKDQEERDRLTYLYDIDLDDEDEGDE